MKLKYLLVVLTFFVSSCASVLPEPKAWMEKGASLTHYKAFEVLPVQDETGNKARSDFLFKQLVAKLRAKGYSVQSASAQEEETLLLRSVVVAFEVDRGVGPFGAARCTVRTALLDKKTGRLLGEMVTSKVSTGRGVEGGIFFGPLGTVLELVAEGIADELERRIKQPQS